MTDEEYLQLEKLLSKLRGVLKHTYCIIPEYIQDGCYIAIYNEKGKPFIEENTSNLKYSVDKILKQIT